MTLTVTVTVTVTVTTRRTKELVDAANGLGMDAIVEVCTYSCARMYVHACFYVHTDAETC